jgi:hypothetical protein
MISPPKPDDAPGPLIGYMRVSKADGSQVLDLQRDALLAAGVQERLLYSDTASAPVGRAVSGLRGGEAWPSQEARKEPPIRRSACSARLCADRAWRYAQHASLAYREILRVS